jgi:4-hydroxy-tetrahydrodipicolinate synthase
MNMTKDRLHGVIIALPTPLLENEELDETSLRSLIDHCIGQGADGIMVLGTMGEGVALTDDVRRRTVDTAVAHTNGRVPLLATVSGASTKKTIENVKAFEHAGVDHLVCTSPFYYKFPDPASLITHIQKTADASGKPLIFYNAPGSTGNTASVDTIDKILNLEGVSGIKDSACQFSAFSELLRRYPDPANRPGTIMQGDESVYDASLIMGADGVVTGGGVLFVSLLKQLCEAGMRKDIEEAMRLQKLFSEKLMEVLLPDLARNWVFNIKKGLADRNIIAKPYATAPFMHNW